MKQDTVNHYLIENGIRPLRARTLVYNYLSKHKNHPTVEMIYKELRSKSPSLSKTTVYNVLNLFVEKDVVQALSIDGKELRFDADISSHGHFRCQRCGQVFDFEVDEAHYPEVPLDGFVSHRTHYYVEGQCATCASPSPN